MEYLMCFQIVIQLDIQTTLDMLNFVAWLIFNISKVDEKVQTVMTMSIQKNKRFMVLQHKVIWVRILSLRKNPEKKLLPLYS